MNIKVKPKQNETGITLIALIVTVILLLILSMVTIRSVTGEASVIKQSKTATEEYNILQYKEQIEQLRESIILEVEIAGESINLDKLAREMAKEATWVKSAIANVKEGTNGINDDIIVTTTDGYIFQLYYNESYGQKFIEYLGKEDGNAIPEVTLSKTNNKITVNASEDVSGINGIEIIYRGDVVKSEKASTLEYEAPKTGWYIIKVTSNEGKLRYAWIRISSTMVAPNIEVIGPSAKPDSNWYKDKVTVRISAGAENTSKIYYTMSRWKEDPILEINNADMVNGSIGKDIEIAMQGATSIYAYAVDNSTGESEIVRYDVLIDNEAPTINDIVLAGEKGENGWYRGDVGISLENAKDNASGIKGYYFYVLTDEEIRTGYIPGIDKMQDYMKKSINKEICNIKDVMKVTEDGIKTIIVRVEDKAGNISSPTTITVKKDSTPPDVPTLMVKDGSIRMREATLVTTKATDVWSSVTYEYYIVKNDESEDNAKLVGTTKSTEFTVTELEPSTTYTAYVMAKDEAGNVSEKSNRVLVQTNREITRPIIKIIAGTERTKWMV